MTAIRRAVVSVSDKRGLVAFARGLAERGVEILSTGGTAKALMEAGIAVTKVSEYTGAREILDGRVKTLHPRIHGGILARASNEHMAELEAEGIGTIDMVVVNLYPFEQTIASGQATLEDAIENIDIGGPTMVRAAAKNHERVTVVTDPDDYDAILDDLAASDGAVGTERRFALAVKAFAHTASYDAAISRYLSAVPASTERSAVPELEPFPAVFTVPLQRSRVLRYGENPHQQAALYRDPGVLEPSGGPSLPDAEVLQGKELSYNNILDLDAAFGCVREFDEPAAVVVKHLNPCGVATSRDVASAYQLARATDPTSAFGGIVAVNREVDAALAEQLAETFLECIIAPGYAAAAREILGKKKNLRLVAADVARARAHWTVRSVAGGVLVQSGDIGMTSMAEAKVVSERKPTADELASLAFAWRVAKHVKSNAIVFARGTQTAAIGAGQMSRIDSVQLCKHKAQMPLAGTCVASDAFFPFRDGLDALADAGASCVVQPGGSIRDDEVIAAANERGVAMVFTGMRHFRH